MSRQITPPLSETEIKVRNIQLETHPQELGKPALLPSHANLSQTQTKDLFFLIRTKEKDWLQDSPKGNSRGYSKGPNCTLATCENGGGGDVGECLVEFEYKKGVMWTEIMVYQAEHHHHYHT